MMRQAEKSICASALQEEILQSCFCIQQEMDG